MTDCAYAMLSWIVAQLSPQAPGFWLLLQGAALLAVALTGRRLTDRQAGRLRAAVWLLIPYTGLLLGGLSPRLMGLTGIDLSILPLGIGLLIGLLVLLAAVRSLISLTVPLPLAADGSEAPSERRGPGWALAGLTLFYTGAEQFHWTFLRGAVWELLLMLPAAPPLPAYRALWIGGALAAGEILLERTIWPLRLVKLLILLITAVLFFYTRSFWLCWILHTAAWFLLAPSPLQPVPSRLGPLQAGE